nr:retrotransposon Orf1 [Tanacetum cinerariifolium]
MFIEIIPKDDDSRKEEPKVEGATTEEPEVEGETTKEPIVEYFDTFLTRDELTYHREDANGGISNFTRRIKGIHVFVRNFTYVIDFMIFEDISSILDPRLSQVVLGRPFIEISNMTHDPPEGVVRFIKGIDEVAYKMPHKIEQYDSLSDLEKEHNKSVYLRNEEDKRRGVEYVMSKILGFYKECLELGPEYLTGIDNEGEVTLGRMPSSLATRLINKEKRFLRGFVQLLIQELRFLENPGKLRDQLLVYFDMKTQREVQLATKINNLTRQLVASIDERRSFIQVLEHLPGNVMAYKTREELKGLQKDELIKAMKMRMISLQFHFRPSRG